jgi:hypothetical protein
MNFDTVLNDRLTVIYGVGNGYFCHCCRYTSTYYKDYKTINKALTDLLAMYVGTDRNDLWVEAVRGFPGGSGADWKLEQLFKHVFETKKLPTAEYEAEWIADHVEMMRDREENGWTNAD